MGVISRLLKKRIQCQELIDDIQPIVIEILYEEEQCSVKETLKYMFEDKKYTIGRYVASLVFIQQLCNRDKSQEGRYIKETEEFFTTYPHSEHINDLEITIYGLYTVCILHLLDNITLKFKSLYNAITHTVQRLFRF